MEDKYSFWIVSCYCQWILLKIWASHDLYRLLLNSALSLLWYKKSFNLITKFDTDNKIDFRLKSFNKSSSIISDREKSDEKWLSMEMFMNKYSLKLNVKVVRYDIQIETMVNLTTLSINWLSVFKYLRTKQW